MTQKELRDYLNIFIESLDLKERELLDARLNSLISVFPFNEYEFILMFLRDKEVISFADYEKLRENYVSYNRYLELFELSPRVFGEIWGQTHIRDIDSRFEKPSKETDPDYDGEYDIFVDSIKIEVKAARAIDTKTRGSLVSKALDTGSSKPFWMNFQQLKLDICDYFIFIGVWVDEIKYWVLTNSEVKENKYISHQHRGGVEYQIGITHKNISEFEVYRKNADEICDIILKSK